MSLENAIEKLTEAIEANTKATGAICAPAPAAPAATEKKAPVAKKTAKPKAKPEPEAAEEPEAPEIDRVAVESQV